MEPVTDGRRNRRWGALAVALAVLLGGVLLGVWPDGGSVTPGTPVAGSEVAPASPPALGVPPAGVRTMNPTTRDAGAAGSEDRNTPRRIEFILRNVGDGRPVACASLTAVWYVDGPLPPRPGSTQPRGQERLVATGTGDDGGIVRLEAPAGVRTGPGAINMDREWDVIRWNRWGIDPEETIPLEAKGPTRIVVWARHVFWLSGRVVDEHGEALPGVAARFVVPRQRPWGMEFGQVTASTGKDGSFRLGPFADEAGAGFSGQARAAVEAQSHVAFALNGHATKTVDPRAIPAADRERVVVTLSEGAVLAGTLVDTRGAALADVAVAVEYDAHPELRRGTRTDAQGKWRLRHVALGRARLSARAFAYGAKAARDIVVERDDLDVRLVAEPIRLARPPATVEVLGLGLCDVTDEIRAAYEVPEGVGVMVWDLGEAPWRLGLGRIERGYGLAWVAKQKVSSVREAVERLLPDPAPPGAPPLGRRSIVYTFWDEDWSGARTTSIDVTEETLKRLRETLERIGH